MSDDNNWRYLLDAEQKRREERMMRNLYVGAALRWIAGVFAAAAFVAAVISLVLR